tara:strand:- start:142 stop:498 length:357 start_codon:yes stop_codon:yes gene_type:complete
MPTVKGFFRKLGADTKQFFRKGGTADVGLRKFGNTLSKVGGVARTVAPLLSIVAPEFGLPLMAAGALAKQGGKTALAIRSGARKGGNIVQKTQNIAGAIKSGIEASKPAADELAMNFA